jgi:hypothetical protein
MERARSLAMMRSVGRAHPGGGMRRLPPMVAVLLPVIPRGYARIPVFKSAWRSPDQGAIGIGESSRRSTYEAGTGSAK